MRQSRDPIAVGFHFTRRRPSTPHGAASRCVRATHPLSPPARAFTLIEVLVAIFIGVLLAGIVTINVVRHVSEARVRAARIQIRELKAAVEQYAAEQGQPPTMEQGLEALVRPPTRPPIPRRYPPEGYLSSRRVPRDPWGREYIYLAPGRDGLPFEIISYGSDGEPGGTGHAADLSSADLVEEF